MLIIGHRGASGTVAENTPEAFVEADRMGADGVELDVRMALDGRGSHRLVVHHDALPADRAALDALPSFDDVLDACGERMLINVEIKNSPDDGGFDPTMAMVPPVLHALRSRGRTWVDRVLVSSFSSATVDHCRLVAPEFSTAVLMTDVAPDAIVAVANGGHAAVHPWHPMATVEFVERAHAAGLAVNVWTANDPADLARLADDGVDGACTDVPDLALEAVGRSSEPVVSPRWASPVA